VLNYVIPDCKSTIEQGEESQMADDRMKNDDLDRNMGGAGQKDQGNYGQKTPGRGQQEDDEFSTGQRGAGQRGEQGHMKDDFGTSEKAGGGQGGQNRQNR